MSFNHCSTPIGLRVSLSITHSLLLVLTRADLARMYGLLMRIPNGLEPLRKKFEEHVKRSGLAAVQKVLPVPGSGPDAGKTEALVGRKLAGAVNSAEPLYRIPRLMSRRCWRYTQSIATSSTDPSEQSWVSMRASTG